MSGWIHHTAKLTDERCDHVIVTLVGIRGSAPQVVGSKMIVTENGLEQGTVGGGKIEAHAIRYAQEIIADKKASELNTWNLQTDIGMSCGGEVSLFFDSNFFSDWTVAIFGAGHVSQELCRVMSTWSCQLRVFDTREEWLERLPSSANIQKKWCEKMSEEVIGLPPQTYLISMTQGHASDVPILEQALKDYKKFAFLGVIGSALKGKKIKKELSELGVASEAIERLQCPLGLPIGNNTPPEISISIAAQILSLRK